MFFFRCSIFIILRNSVVISFQNVFAELTIGGCGCWGWRISHVCHCHYVNQTHLFCQITAFNIEIRSMPCRRRQFHLTLISAMDIGTKMNCRRKIYSTNWIWMNMAALHQELGRFYPHHFVSVFVNKYLLNIKYYMSTLNVYWNSLFFRIKIKNRDWDRKQKM